MVRLGGDQGRAGAVSGRLRADVGECAVSEPLSGEERAALRAYLEQTAPWRGDHTPERTEHDIRSMWALLLEVERLGDALDRYGKHERSCGAEYDRP
jgi:hypothetical protein